MPKIKTKKSVIVSVERKTIYLPCPDTDQKFSTNNKLIKSPYLPESHKVIEPLGYVFDTPPGTYVASSEKSHGNKRNHVKEMLDKLRISYEFDLEVSGWWCTLVKNYRCKKSGALEQAKIWCLVGWWEGTYGLYVDKGDGEYEKPVFECRTYNEFKTRIATFNLQKRNNYAE